MIPEVKIVTDSTAYLEPEVIKKYDIRVVPIKVAFGGEAYSEGIDIANDQFYERVIKGGAFPTTSQPPVGEFVQVYTELAGRGHPILSIHISSTMSGTVGSALAARNTLPEAQIEVIDSRTLAMGMLVAPAAVAAARGQPLGEIKASIERLNSSIKVVGMFENLKYAWKGGRIGAARALLGTILRIKPVLTIEEGEVKVVAKPRTLTGAVEHISAFVEKRAGQSTRLYGWLAHAHVPQASSMLEKELRSRFVWADLRVFELGPVFATHMGPGFAGLSFYSDADLR